MNDAGFKTVLVPDQQSLVLPLGCSFLFHVGLAISAWTFRGAWTVLLVLLGTLFPFCRAPEPTIFETIEVSMVSLPKSATNVPDRAARAPRDQGQDKPVDVPPPIKESDLAVKTKTPPPKPGNTVDDLRRQELVDQMTRDDLLRNIDMPDGPVDRDPTDPDGDGEIALTVLGIQAKGDPEYAKWYTQVKLLIEERFKPVGADASLRARGLIQVDGKTGKVVSTELSQPSKVLQFDAAAERAMQGLTSIPLPPEKYLPLLRDPIAFDFEPP